MSVNEIENETQHEIENEVQTQEVETEEVEKSEASEAPESTATESSDEKQTEDSKPTIPEELKEQFGKALAYERTKLKQRLQQQYAQELAAIRARAESNFSEASQDEIAPVPPKVFDPETGEYVSSDSVIGQMIIRNQKVAARKMRAVAETEAQEFSSRIADGHGVYDNYDDALNVFVNHGTDAMAEALKGIDNPSALIHYLSDKPGELQRISKLSPAKQAREIYRLDDRLNPTKKLVTKATEPIAAVNQTKNIASAASNQSFAQRDAYYREKFKG